MDWEKTKEKLNGVWVKKHEFDNEETIRLLSPEYLTDFEITKGQRKLLENAIKVQ